jgi:2'-5' RNA ligase
MEQWYLAVIPDHQGPRWHMTITFLGNIDTHIARDLEANLREALGESMPIQILIGKSAMFGAHNEVPVRLCGFVNPHHKTIFDRIHQKHGVENGIIAKPLTPNYHISIKDENKDLIKEGIILESSSYTCKIVKQRTM